MTKAIVRPDEDTTVLEWRTNWLRAGGFNKRNARLIAESTIDWRYANEVLKNCKAKGYSETFVVNLLL